MKPGDTCVVRAGTYREAVRVEASGVPGRPIRFVAAKEETVVLDGAEPIAGEWQLHSGNIYKTRVPDPIRHQAIQQRQRHKKDSPEWQRHHAVVAKLHRDLWHELRDKGATTLTGADRAAFTKAMGGK
jgi:hypothetical protein